MEVDEERKEEVWKVQQADRLRRGRNASPGNGQIKRRSTEAELGSQTKAMVRSSVIRLRFLNCMTANLSTLSKTQTTSKLIKKD